MPSPLEQLEPRSIWQHFDAIRQVPRPSKHEGQITDYVRGWAKEHGFGVRSDASGNLVIEVPPSSGKEAAPIVVLQAHLDMVCEKNAGVEHDFMNDPIQVQVDDDWVSAAGTTLGADNGLGAASAMAMAVDPEVTHGPLELLFTLDEETGLNGASALDPAIVTGQILVNLDTEEDDSVYIGCAGAAGIEATFGLERMAAEEAQGEVLELAIRGLRGGHSGVDIIENRGNAIKVAARLLVAAIDGGVDFDLISFQGGSKRNAIARECFAQLAMNGAARQRFEELIQELSGALESELGAIDPELMVELRPPAEPSADHPISKTDRDRLLRVILAVPHGVLTMSREVTGLVETSNNLAVVTTDSVSANVLCSIRSSVTPALAGTLQALRALFRLAEGRIEEEAGYPGWKPNPDSPVVRRTVAVYERLFGETPHIKAVHAGLECGILTQKIAGLDAVSIGPEIRNAHSPDEKASISSTAKFYRLLRELLADLAG
ncbi:MAG: aminoacyl-histidine dipeptidase [Acidobacteriota bacterium]